MVVRNLARVWHASSIPATILVNDWDTPRIQTTDKATFKLRLALISLASSAGALKSLIVAPRTLFRTWRMLRDLQISGVVFHYASLDALGILLLKRLALYRGRVALCFHGTDVRVPRNAVEAALWKWMFASADGVSVCSSALADEVHSTFGLDLGRIAVIYNGVDMQTFAPYSGLHQTPGAAPYIVSVGSFIERKGHRFLLEAFAHLASKHPGVGLIVVGMDGDERTSLETWALEHKLDERVKFLVGLTPEQVAEVVSRASLCVQPSLAEPFGMAVIEAGACGVLVAASAVGGHIELIEHGKTGLLFPPADADAIAQTLDRYFSDVSPYATMRTRFREQVLARYTWENCARQYRSLTS